MHLRTALFIAAVLLAGAGCRRPSPQAEAQQQLATYAALRLTQESHHQELQAELAHVRASRGLPAMIDADRGLAAGEAGCRSKLADALESAFTFSQLKFACERSDKLFAHRVAEWNPLVLEQALSFRTTYDVPHQRMRTAFASPGAGLLLPLTAGLGLKNSFADAALVYVRCEAVVAAEAISQGDAAAALQAIAHAMQVVEMLADEPHVVARLSAAAARRETFGAVQRMVNSRIVTAAHRAQLERLVSRQLAAWPHDAEAWRGDRALGLCTYEMIRDGQILSVLTEDELVEIRRGAGIENFAAAVAKNVDIDEAHYLREMRGVIAQCDKLYYQRVAVLEQQEKLRQQLRDSPEYPIIADRLLLPGVAAAQRQQAADLALARAWSMALAIACGASLPPPEVNPLTGDVYHVAANSQRVVVANIDPRHPEVEVIVPITQPQVEAARERVLSY